MSELCRGSLAVSSLNHLTIAVSDVTRSLGFYRDLLGCREHARWDEGAYLSAGDLWLCLSRDEPSPARDYTHVAFTVRAPDIDAWRARLVQASVPLWKENRSEGASVYCLDPDGHQLELHVGGLNTRLASLERQPYAGLRMPPRPRAPFEGVLPGQLRLLLVAGSVRRTSVNRAFMHRLADQPVPGVAVERFDAFDRLPCFSPDEVSEPALGHLRHEPELGRWLAAVRGADAVLFACPEYAGGLPGAFKNGLDHLVGSEAFIDKPFVLYNLAPRAHHAQQQLELILSTMSGRPLREAFRTLDVGAQAGSPDASWPDPDTAAAMASSIERIRDACAASGPP